jgi:pimeloyl-ACP methyl ester carboxylesterase
MPCPAVVLLPGMMLDRRLYARQTPALSPHVEVVHGDLTAQDSIEAMARSVLAASPDRFALVGHSMGGIVALEICRQAPERVSHLALLNTTPYAEREERLSQRLEQMAAVEAGGLRDVLVHSMKPRYLAACHRADADLLEAVLDMGLALGPAVFQRQSAALKDRPEASTLLAQIRCPSLVLCGREDALCPPAFHEAMASQLPCGDLVVLSRCGHLSPMESPDAVASALLSLLARKP